MPGIYVQTLSQSDWFNQENLITIPGSYWLCHKKNIYKFIFKYHRTVKNTMQFSYVRELLKIVRRVIKCHPNQGQQFGTPHLLVTYNCTSWTRQDKMLAILKFQQQTNAATFSHAFALTIKIYPSSEHSLFSLKYPIVKEADAGTTFKDLNMSLDIEDKITETTMYTTDKVSARKAAIYQEEDQVSKHEAIQDTFDKSAEIKNSNFQDNIAKNSENFGTQKQKSRESERKTIPDDKVMRSSNITDLVMEGLMFTIRQDQDSVTVIEQKTKLEMDEVLENSEKVETKAGEKCLLNSSLLKLENLVTMIDSPRNRDKKQHKTTCHAICNNTCLSPFNTISNNTVHNLDVNSADEKMDKLNNPVNYDNVMDYSNPCNSQWQRECISSSIKNDNYSARETTIEKSEKLIKHDNDNECNKEDGNNIEMKEEERMDFIPQVFQPTFSSEDTGLQNEDLSSDNKDTEETNKYELSVKRFCSSLQSCSLSSSNNMFTKEENSIISEDSDEIDLPRQQTNGPRIVSNKAVIINEMPLALQKVLRNTYKTRKLSSTFNNEILQNKQETQHITEPVISETVDSFIDNNINSNLMNDSSNEFTIDSVEINSSNNESSTTIDKNIAERNKDICVRNGKEKNNESNRTLRKSLSSKNDLPRNLQDITEDFYYDLLHVRNKSNAIRQRRLRHRQKSSNNPNNIKNDKIRIEMLKFIQDITEGVRVMVRRLNIDNKSTLLKKSSTLTTCMH